jgi:hypothetical protein
MKRLLLPALLIVLILIAMPQTAFAKAPTSKLFIEGEGLTKALELTDPRILEVSKIWSYGDDSFLDYSRKPAKNSPRNLRAYEVSFYVKHDQNEIKKMYDVRYYPNPSGQGYMYLPGDKDAWGAGNKGSIIRAGRDGKWNYVSPAWEQLVKPLIATAEATDLLHEVAQQYASLTQYDIETVEESEFKGELSHNWNKEYRTLARDSEKRYRFEFKAPYQWTTVISDGTTKWAVQPWRAEYSRTLRTTKMNIPAKHGQPMASPNWRWSINKARSRSTVLDMDHTRRQNCALRSTKIDPVFPEASSTSPCRD